MTRLPRRTIPFLALLLLLAAPLGASPSWVPLGPYGGSVEQIVVDPSDERVVFSLTDEQVLFKSTDGGGNWQPLRMLDFLYSSVQGATVAPARRGTVYLATGEKLLKSADGGASWNEAGPPSINSISAVAVDPAQASRVYAGGSGIWISTNRGASWKPARSPLPSTGYVNRLIAARQPAGTVFAITWTGVYKSVDAGLTWRALPLPGAIEKIGPFAVAPSDSRWLYACFGRAGLFRSTNGGGTWQPAGRQPAADETILSLAVSPRSPRTLWLVTDRNGLFRSADGGDTWTATGPKPLRHAAAVAVAPSSPRTVYAGLTAMGTDAGGAFASTDGGGTWTRRNRGLFGLDLDALALDPDNPGTLWSAHQGGLYHRAGADARWERMPLPPPPPPWGFDFSSIVLDPAAPSTLYALGGGLWRTSNGGESWTDLFATGTPHPPYLYLLRMDPEDSSKLWGAGGGRLHRSADAGVHWDTLKYPDPGCGLYDLAFAPSSPSTLYASGSHRFPDELCWDWARAAFFRSTDGGATWSDISSGFPYNSSGFDFDVAGRIAVDPVDPRLVYVGTRAESKYGGCDGVWKSADGGTTWARAGKDIGCVTAVAASPVAGVVWASNEEGQVFRSGDAGATWKNRTQGLLAHSVYDLMIDPANPRRVYAATSGGVWTLETEEP